MGKEIDLLVHYPKTKRNLEERVASNTEADRVIARQFGCEFFDGLDDCLPAFGQSVAASRSS